VLFSARIERQYATAFAMLAIRASPAMPSRFPGTDRKEGNIVNRFALAAALAIGLGSIAQAKVIDLVPEAAGNAPPVQARAAEPGAGPPAAFALPSSISELPEPEVFAMMLVGLILLGYRARRDSSEKFK
jgi:hypothetical protein